jgi:hypothetical protein
MTTTCEVPNCGDDVHAKGYCVKHYYKMKRTGTLQSIKPGPKKPESGCSVPECLKDLYAKGHCQKHYYREKRTGSTDNPMTVVRGADKFNEAGHKWCSRCRDYVDDTHKSSWCTECKKLARFKMTKQEYQNLLKSQNYQCPVCGKKDPDHIDHDHNCCEDSRQTCGKCVRGILHRQCNAMLGNVEPNLDRIITYLRGRQ